MFQPGAGQLVCTICSIPPLLLSLQIVISVIKPTCTFSNPQCLMVLDHHNWATNSSCSGAAEEGRKFRTEFH